jgi:uncharacterized membrane protein YedE/YeeE
VSSLGLIGAGLVGVAFGYCAQRGAFCMNSGLRSVVDGEWTRVKALGQAVGVQLLLLPIVFATGMARSAELSLMPAAAIAGGVLFGISMRWAGGCAAGVWYKLGAGDVGALLAVLGMAIGAIAAESGPLRGFRLSLQEAIPSVAPWTPPLAVLLAAGFALLAALARAGDGHAGAWSWRRTGLWIGVVATIAWPISAASGRDFGLAVVPGTTGLLSAVSGQGFAAWDVVLVLGILIGGRLAMRVGGAVVSSAPRSAVLLKRLAGGVGLGVGSSIAAGCTVGQGLTGLALLAPSSVVVMMSIFAGSAGAAVVARRQGTLSNPLLPSSPA